MSYDLVIWSGAPSAPTRRWAAIQAEDESAAPPLPHTELLASLRATFGDDLRVSPFENGSAVQGRGWEVDVGPGTHAVVSCAWALAGEPAKLGALVRAAHAAGCSVYDPQHGAHWPTFATPGEDDLWQRAFFDESWIYEDEDDDEGHIAEQPTRLQPNDVAPDARQVSVELPAALARAAPGDTRRRLAAYAARFDGWDIFAVFTGPESDAPSIAECRKLLRKAEATPTIAETVGVVSFHVLGTFDAITAMSRIDPCPFEVVAQTEEEVLLATIFGELPVRWIVVVGTRTLRDAPDTVRAGLRSLLTAVETGPVHFADPLAPAKAPVGANIAWVEALLGLAPSEAPIAVDAATVPRPKHEAGGGDA